MKNLTVGVLAHVDAGKTTLSEAILYRSGQVKTPGRVDHGDSALDTHALERARGITIFSAQAVVPWNGARITLLDTPGHVDFSAEMERTLGILDCAVLVVSGADGVQAHTETLWRLLRRYDVPTFLFVTKMDLPAADKLKLLADLTAHLDEHILDFTARPADEELAMCSESALDRYMAAGALTDGDITELIARRALFPCLFGSGLRIEGVDALLDALVRWASVPDFPAQLGARVYKISYDPSGARLTHVRVTGGALRVRQTLTLPDRSGAPTEEKITGIRICSGAKSTAVEQAEAGEVCALTGLTASHAGQGLGFEPDLPAPVLTPALTYRLALPDGADPMAVMPLLRRLEEEDPLLRFAWDAAARQVHLQLMGPVQIAVLESVIAERYGLAVRVDAGHIQYKETIAAPVEGAGHFEPLRHYAEVHLLLEPLEPGRGIELETDCPTELLDLNWQRLVLTHLAEKQHRGVLTGAPLTDVRITLLAGRAHLKHTGGGDFRQATYRAVRQGLMKAQNVLLEPYYRFRLEVPAALTGRAISDLRAMHGDFSVENTPVSAILEGKAPVACLRDYSVDVAAYTGGRGSFSCIMAGYFPCHNAEQVIAAAGYAPEADLENTPDSVFCAHGAGVTVKWDKVDEYCHVDSGRTRGGAPAAPRLRVGSLSIDEKELEAIMLREFGPIRRPMYTSPVRADPAGAKQPAWREKREVLVIDGYNVIFAWDELKAIAQDHLDTARRRLEEALVNYHGFTGSDVVLVFDGYAVKGNPGEKQTDGGIRVVYTKENESADLYIERLLHDIGRNRAVRLVTSDNLIRLSALGSGIARTSAREFGHEMDWVMGQIGEILRRSAEGGHTVAIRDGKL